MSKQLEAGKLIVGTVAVCIDPTGIAATTLGFDAALQAKSWMSKKPDIEELADELTKAFNKRLKEKQFDKPANARTLLPQMLDNAMPDRDGLADCGLDAQLVLDEMHKTLHASGDVEHQQKENLDAFDTLIAPLLETACNDPRLKAALDPALTRKQMQLQKQTLEAIENLPEKLNHISALSREALENLAARFGIENAYDKGEEELRGLLTDKANDYRALRQQIAALDDNVVEIAELKVKAQAAADAGNLEEVDQILTKADVLETAAAASTKITRANNALLRNRPEQAFDILSAIADSFRSADPLAPIKLRAQLFVLLRDHGLRYGGNGMQLAEKLLEDAADDLPEDAPAELLPVVYGNLAVVRGQIAPRLAGPDFASKIGRAAEALRELLEHLSKDDPQWAMTQHNLGITLRNQATRTDGEEGNALLADAVIAYNAALTVRTKDDQPVQWAMTQNNLGNALSEQGIRTEGAAGTALLADAVTAFNAALTVRTKDDHPVDWAMTQNNLGSALQNQGTRTEGAAGTDLLTKAVTAYTAALTVTTKDAHPVYWAETQENLAIVELEIAEHDATPDPRPHLEAAFSYVDAALTVFDPEHMSFNFEKATRLGDRIKAGLADLS